MAVRTRTFPSGDCASIASTACVYTQAKKQAIFLPGKVAPLLLVGDIPKPLSLAPDTERLNRCRKRQYVHMRPPYGGIHERMDITMKNRTRKHAFLIYLSDDEKRILDAKYKLSGMRSRAAYIRQLIIEGIVYDVDYSYLRDYNIGLGKIGTNINQIAHRINETRSIYQTDIDEIKKEMKKLWQLQESMLSKQPYLEQ